MALQWISTSARTGFLISDLPTFEPDWPLRRTLCKYETATGALHLDGASRNWLEATQRGGAVLHCYDDEDPALELLWSGHIITRTRDASDEVKLSLVTTEGYFDRRFVGDEQFLAAGQNLIADRLISQYAADRPGWPGLPLTAAPVSSSDGDGAARDQLYQNTDNATLYSRLGQLAGLDGGLEWFVRWVWTDDGTGVRAEFVRGTRVGVPAGPDGPSMVFEMPGPVVDFSLLESYEDGKGANYVSAYSSGQGDSTPFSAPWQPADMQGMPVYEYRYQPQASVTDQTQLDAYARQAGAILAPGQNALTLTAQITASTRHGGGWSLGDDVGAALGTDGSVRSVPGGYVTTGRALAYELNDAERTISPILAVVGPDGTDDTA